MTEDAELLRRYVEEHCESAFSEFVNRHLNLVYFTALRTTSSAASAQEVSLKVFSIAAGRGRALIKHPTIAGWLYTTARHESLRASNKERIRQRYELQASMEYVFHDEPHEDWSKIRPIIDDALHDLAKLDRELILLRFFEGRSLSDLGASKNLSPDAARMRVDRALGKLRLALKRRGVDSVSAGLATILAAQGTLAAPAGMGAVITSGAISAAVAPAALTTAIAFMSGAKLLVTATALAAVVATSTATFEFKNARKTEARLNAALRDLTSAKTEIAHLEQLKKDAQKTAEEADTDNSALLEAVDAARTKTEKPTGKFTGLSASQKNDPLSKTLESLFANGIVVNVGNRTITVADVRRAVQPRLADLKTKAGNNPSDLRQLLYAAQNDVITSLVNRDLNVMEFNQPLEGEQPRRITPDWVDRTVAEHIKEQANNSEAKFQEYLADRGMTPSEFRQSVEDDLANSFMHTQQRRLISKSDLSAQSRRSTPPP